MNKEDTTERFKHRRLLLKFIAGSPLLSLGFPFVSSGASSELFEQEDIISSASSAINVFDFQKAAKAKLPPAHYGYMATGVLDDRTLIENEKAYSRIGLKMRQLSDIVEVDMTTQLFDESWSSPIFICPCGSQKAFHPDGEIATAMAAKTEDHLQILSTMSTSSIKDVTAAKGSPPWFQLYPSDNWEDTLQMVKCAESSGCPVLVLTVDMDYTDKRETYLRMARLDQRDCRSCHKPGQYTRNKPILNQLSDRFTSPQTLSWDFVKKLKQSTQMKVVLKGIVSGQDAALALDSGIDGLIVSNHGGRAAESGISTIDSLRDVTRVVKDQIPVLVDGGVRRGKDVFKALAMGASAVGIGRPYLWGLGSFGREGVEMVLKILKEELKLAMQQTGVKSIEEINKSQLM